MSTLAEILQSLKLLNGANEMTKTEQVYQYLMEQLNEGTHTKDELLSFTVRRLKAVPELSGIGKTSIAEGLSRFKSEMSKAPDIRLDISDIKSDSNADINSDDQFLNRLRGNQELIFELLEEHQKKKQLQELDLTNKTIESIRQYIQHQHPIEIPPANKGKGIGTTINEDLFNTFQLMVKNTGLTQRYAIHLAIALCNEYCSTVLEGETIGKGQGKS
jgi:hypothetical protein